MSVLAHLAITPTSTGMFNSRIALTDRDCRVLESMTRGTVYEVREVATATGLGMSLVRHILVRLYRRVNVARIEPVWRGLPVQWRRALVQNG